MATCPECDADIDFDEYDVDKGDMISCPECGTNLEVVSVSPLEFEATPTKTTTTTTKTRIEDDDDEDDDDEDEDEDDGRRRRGLGGVSSVARARRVKEARLSAVLADFESILVAYSGGVDSAYLACAASRALPGSVLCVTADSPSYPRRHRDMAEAIARRVPPAARVRRDRASSNGPSTAPTRPIAAITARPSCTSTCRSVASDARLRRHRRWQQRRRPRRLPARAGRPRASSACRSPLDEADLTKDEIRELSRRGGPAHLGRAGVGVPVVAHPVPERGDRGQAVDDRAGRGGAAPSRLPRVPRPASRHARAARDRPRRDGARARSRDQPARSSASSRPSATSTCVSTCRATAPAA